MEEMKIKARDIIPGWPRPRSTSSWDYLVAYFLYFPRFLRDERFHRDVQANYEYHQAQQLMVTQFLEEPLNRMLFGLRYERLVSSGKTNDVRQLRDCLLFKAR
jgi:hypothetical protein